MTVYVLFRELEFGRVDIMNIYADLSELLIDKMTLEQNNPVESVSFYYKEMELKQHASFNI